MVMAPGFFEMMAIFSLGMGGMMGSTFLGMPPGERDAALVKAAPADALIYAEWSHRGKPVPGGKGVDGLVADPEVKQFLTDVRTAILKGIEDDSSRGGPEEQVLGKAIPYLVETLVAHAGSISIKYDAKAVQNFANAPGVPAFVAPLAGLQATVIVNAGDDAEEFAAKLTDAVRVIPAELRQGESLKRLKFAIPIPGLELTLHRHETYFILGFGAGTVDAAIAGLSGESTGLSKNARFAKNYSRVEIERLSTVSWIDVKGIVAAVSGALGPQGAMVQGVAQMVGADAIDSVTGATGVVDGKITSRSFIDTGGKTSGVLALAAGRGITASDFGLVPADADFVMAMSFSAPKILAAVQDILQKADPPTAETIEMTIQQLESELGLKLKEDVFAAFGDVWVIHDSPGGGGVLASSLVASLEVKDAAKAKAVFDKVMKIVEASLPGEYGRQYRRRGVFLGKKSFLGTDCYYINTVGNEVPVAPTFCVTDKQLLLALHPQAIKAHLRFLQNKEETFAGRIGKDIKLPEGDLLQFSYFESRELVRYLYAMAPYFGQIMFSEFQSHGGEIDIFSLPSARAVLPYVENSTSSIVRTPEGLVCEGTSALPLPLGTGLIGTMLPWVMLSVDRVGGGMAVPAIDAPAGAAEAVEEDVPVRTVPAVKKPLKKEAEKKAVPKTKPAPKKTTPKAEAGTKPGAA